MIHSRGRSSGGNVCVRMYQIKEYYYYEAECPVQDMGY